MSAMMTSQWIGSRPAKGQVPGKGWVLATERAKESDPGGFCGIERELELELEAFRMASASYLDRGSGPGREGPLLGCGGTAPATEAATEDTRSGGRPR